MALNPVFVADLPGLKAALRLSDMPETGSGTSLLYEAMRNVRLGFIRELGLTTVQTIQGYSLSEEPSTNEEVLRSLAARTEVKWVRYELMATMPSLFMEAGSAPNEVWNEEAPFRQESQRAYQEKRMALWMEIQEALEFLSGDTDLGGGVEIKATTFGPEEDEVIKPSETTWPQI